jgi:hypothetical protein
MKLETSSTLISFCHYTDNTNLYFGTVEQMMLNLYDILDYNLLSLFKSHELFL